MQFRCPACEHETVATVLPAGDLRYALCDRCASYYLNPMPGAGKLEREPERLAQFLQSLQGAGPAIERQILRALPKLDSGGIVASDLDLLNAPERLSVRQVRSLAEPGAVPRVDALVLTSFIERVPIPDMAAQWCLEKLKPGGVLVMSTPNANFARRVIAAKSSGGNMKNVGLLLKPETRRVVYSATGLRALLERNGFTKVRVRSAAPAFTTPDTALTAILLYLASRAVETVLPRVILSGLLFCTAVREE